jgi:hypothetical protein
MTVEFDCVDCGWHVVDVAGIRAPGTRCLSCEWLAESPLVPAERERLRAILSPPLARGPPSEAPS